jgi:hypothetical protein
LALTAADATAISANAMMAAENSRGISTTDHTSCIAFVVPASAISRPCGNLKTRAHAGLPGRHEQRFQVATFTAAGIFHVPLMIDGSVS